MNNAVEIVETLDYHARKIDTAHREVVYAGKSMLAWAKEAGHHLLMVKEKVRHGEFKAWVEANCQCSYQSAAVYMKVAREWDEKSSVLDFSTASLRDFVGNKPKTPCPTVTTIDRDDAAHALKLQALVERGSTEAERDVAKRKLEAFAKGFGHTPEALVEKAQDILPDAGKTTYQAEAEAFKAEAAALRAQLNAILARTQELETEVQKLSREELVARYIGLVLEREGLTELKKAA